MNDCDTETPASTTYRRASLGWAALYVALVVALSSARNAHLLVAPWNWLTAWTPAIPIAGLMWSLLVYMRDSDEFVRALTGKRVVVALALTLVLCSIWGFLEVYAGAPHEEMYLVFPIFWLSYVGVSAVVRSST